MSHDGDSHTCACGGNCGCNDSQASDEHTHLTREEYIGELQRYLRDLKAEVTAVEAELVKMQASTLELVAP
jgi:hypothetical protein